MARLRHLMRCSDMSESGDKRKSLLLTRNDVNDRIRKWNVHRSAPMHWVSTADQLLHINEPWCFLTKLKAALGPVSLFGEDRCISFVRSFWQSVCFLLRPSLSHKYSPAVPEERLASTKNQFREGSNSQQSMRRESRPRPRPASNVTAVHHGPRPAAASPPETNSGATCGIGSDARTTSICH